jgi:threonine/homoserine/homoserine lactone efflux protein
MLAPEVLLPFLFAALAVCVAPGPDMAFVVASGVSAGRRGGLLAAAGIAVGVGVYAVLTALGVGALMRAIPAVMEAVRFAGAVYLGYLAFVTWRAAGSAQTGGDVFVRRPGLRVLLDRVAAAVFGILALALLAEVLR